MTAVFKVLDAGFCTTIQDSGRRGFQDVGVPASGPLDRIAFRLANTLAGNSVDAPALEILGTPPVLEVMSENMRLALVGGTPGLTIKGEAERSVPMGQSAVARRGEIVRLKALTNWPSAYLAIEGGFAGDVSMGSAATYRRATFGGLQGRPLLAGDVLKGRIAEASSREEKALARAFPAALDRPVRVVMGPQDDAFTEEAKERFLSTPFTVSPQADRMGIRLEGELLRHAGSYDLVSDGIVPGSVQVPGSCQPIVMMVDHQTTGGYPKIATVISADIPVLGRRRPGSVVRFQAVSRTEAEDIRRAQEAMLRAWMSDFQAVRDGASINTERLYDANLIDGVQDAYD